MTLTPINEHTLDDHARRASVVTRDLWYRLRSRSAADRALIASAMRERCAGLAEPAGTELPWLGAVFQRYMEATGRTSERGYRKWRQGEPDSDELPTSDYLRKALGGPDRSWDKVKEMLGGVYRADVRALRLLRGRREASRDEVLEAVRFWSARQAGALKLEPFIDWCRAEAEASEPEYRGWAVISLRAIYKNFGSWAELLDEIGAHDEATRARGWSEQREQVSVDAMCELLRLAADELTVRLDENSFGRWLLTTDVPEVIALNGRPMNTQVISSRIGSLPRALFQAGVIDLEEFAARLNGAAFMTEDEMLASLAAFVQAHGPTARPKTFEGWRRARIREAAAQGHLLLIPKPETLSRRLVGCRRFSLARDRAAAWLDAGGVPSVGVIKDELQRPVA